MQKIATKVFVCSSVIFGIIGIILILNGHAPDGDNSPSNQLLMKLLFITVFIILPSFALSVAGKYLNNK